MRSLLGFDPRYWTGRAACGIADQAMFSGANFLVGIALARWLPVGAFGWFSILFAGFLIAAGFHNALVVEPLSVLGPSRFRTQFAEYGRRVIGLHFLVCALLAGLFAIPAWLFARGAEREAALAAAAALPFMLVIWLVRRYFHTQLKPGLALRASSIYMVAVLGGVFLLKLCDRLSVAWVFPTLAAAGLLAGLTYWGRRRPGDLREGQTPDGGDIGLRQVAREHLAYGRWHVAADIVAAIGVHGPTFWTAAYLGLDATAALRAATNLTLPMAQVVTAISILVLPVLARDFAEGQIAAMKRKARTVSLGLLALSTFYLLLLLAFAGPVESLVYDGKYAGYSWLIPLLGLIPVILAASTGWSMTLRAAQRPLHYFVTAATTSGAGIAAAAILIPSWGLSGAAAGLVLSYLAGAAALFAMSRRWLRTPALRGAYP